jgi:hypothetical protein
MELGGEEMEQTDKAERLRKQMEDILQPVMERLDRIEAELKELKEQQNK